MKRLPVLVVALVFMVAACGDEEDNSTPQPKFDVFVPPTNDMGSEDLSSDAEQDDGGEEFDIGVDMYVGPSLVVSPEATLRVNETLQMSVTRVQEDEMLDVTADAAWSIQNESVATIDASGLITAIAEGTTSLTSTYEDISTTVDLRVFGSFVSIASGATHNCALTRTGRVACWGSSTSGAHGTNSPETLLRPTVIDTRLRFVDLTAGRDHSCGLTAAGGLWCWGDNARGQLGDGTTTSTADPVQVSGIGDVESVAAGDDFTCALTVRDEQFDIAGSVYCWGDNARFQLGLGQGDFESAPQLVTETEEAGLLVSAGARHACALIDRNALRLLCWGDHQDQQLGQAMGDRSSMAVEIASGVTSMAAGGTMTCFDSTSLECLGTASFSLGDPGATVSSAAAISVETGGQILTLLQAGSTHACYATNDSSSCWGSNAMGQLGNNTQDDAAEPTEVFGMPALLDLSLGQTHTCAIGAGGGAFCWGDGSSGQIGNGSSVSQLRPTATALPEFR